MTSACNLIRLSSLGEIPDIEGVIYGAFSSTFFKYQQEILDCIHNNKSEKFQCWQCVSLKLEYRTFDFVIKNDKEVMDFIFCVQSLVNKANKYRRLINSGMMKRKTHINYASQKT